MIFNFKFSLLVIQLSQKITLTCLNKNNNNLRFKFSHISYLIYIYFQVSLLEWRCEEDTIACGERVYTISYIRNKKLQSSQQHPYNFRTIFSNLIVLRVLSLTVFSPLPPLRLKRRKHEVTFLEHSIPRTETSVYNFF